MGMCYMTIDDDKGVEKIDTRGGKQNFYSISRATLSVELVQVLLNLATPFPFNA